MKTYLVTYYFTNGEVHAVRYKDEELQEMGDFIEQFCDDKKRIFYAMTEDETDMHLQLINLNNVCRFTIDEVENE